MTPGADVAMGGARRGCDAPQGELQLARKDGAHLEISRSVTTMSAAGLAVFFAGIAMSIPELRRGRGLERAIAFGPAFVAAPLATFGGLHLAAAAGLSQMVPAWIPWHLFWAYFVGVALIATALSLISGRLVRWSALLCAAMLLIFVATIHVPGLIATPNDRFAWIVLARDSGFAAGLLALAGSVEPQSQGWLRLSVAGRIWFAAGAVFFAVEHFLHPEHVPGVPLERLTPAWALAPRAWGYAIGAVLLASGALMLVNRWARQAAAWLGIAVTVAVIVIYAPMVIPAHGTAEVVDAINYIADTLLYAGTALIIARSTETKGAAAAEQLSEAEQQCAATPTARAV